MTSEGVISGPTQVSDIPQTGKWAEPYVPTGFTHIDGTWDTGYVIQDDVTKSEFVWIPVGGTINGTTINLERINYDANLLTDEYAKNNGYNDLAELLNARYGVSTIDEFWEKFEENADYIEDFKTSVTNNGGFYIGRYEASNTDGKVTTKQAAVWNMISQTDAVAKCKEMYEGNGEIKSALVNSYAWDTALKFIEVVEGKNVDTDSNSWGNYNSSLAETGATAIAKACNIYDMAGNVWK